MTLPASLGTEPARTPSTGGALPLADEKPGRLHPGAERMKRLMDRCRMVADGTDAVRDAKTDVLPLHLGEDATDYERRLHGAELYNAFDRTLTAMTGLICQRDPVLGKDGQDLAEIRADWEEIDDLGTHGAVFTRRLAGEGLKLGLAGILVDHPTRIGPRPSLPDEKRLNLRPYWVQIRGEQILDWDHVTIGAKAVLTWLVLSETADRRVGRFGRTSVERYRVFERELVRDDSGRVTGLGSPTVQVWEKGENDTEVKPLSDPVVLRAKDRDLSAIPFSPYIAGPALGGFETRPPLVNLADLNLAHFRVSADRRNVLHLACVPTLVLSGYAQPEATIDPATGEAREASPIVAGANAVLIIPNADGKAYYAAPDAGAFEPTREELEAIERRMAAVGMAFLQSETRAAETAESKRIDAAAQNATLASAARALQDCLELAMVYHAEYRGIAEPVSITVNTDFERTILSPQMVDVLSRLVDANRLTLETFLQIIESGRVIPDGTAVSEAKALRGGGGAPAPASGAGDSAVDALGAALAEATLTEDAEIPDDQLDAEFAKLEARVAARNAQRMAA